MAIKGFITFYINFFPELQQDVKAILDLTQNYNKEVIAKLQEVNYEVMFVPTTKEASRVEKIDLDQPHPRFVTGKVELARDSDD